MARITVKVQPSAGHNEVVRREGGVWRLRIAASPEKGKANRELVEFLSDVLGVSNRDVTIETGLTARTKVVSITGMAGEEIAAHLISRAARAKG